MLLHQSKALIKIKARILRLEVFPKPIKGQLIALTKCIIPCRVLLHSIIGKMHKLISHIGRIRLIALATQPDVPLFEEITC